MGRAALKSDRSATRLKDLHLSTMKIDIPEGCRMRAACMTWFGVTFVAGTVLAASPARAGGIELPGGATVEKVDFERHVMGLFGRMGCNSGSCHGSFQGKGGFRLSLFGYEPEKDFRAVTRDLQGRRIDRNDPDNSLILLKATARVEHGGQRRFGKDTWAYQLLKTWIRQGATWTKGSGQVAFLRVASCASPLNSWTAARKKSHRSATSARTTTALPRSVPSAA
jgi:hypothetical protein